MVGVCIKFMHENYGGMLQAYATVSYLQQQKIAYELICYTRRKNLRETIRDIPRLFNAVWLNSRYEGVQRRLSLKIHRSYAEMDAIRMRAFAQFREWAFHGLSEEYIGYAALCEGGKKYNAVITGSDQLWSPAGLPTNFFNLMFVPDDILKISVASSFGVREIPWYQKKRTKQFLNRMDHISMRENRGSQIVEDLTGRRVPTILDPVFFLSAEEWLERIPDERLEAEPYIFAYFLGTNPEHREAVKELAKQKQLKIVALRHMDQYVAADECFGDSAPYDLDPRGFLNLLRNADYVCTDSFHGTAFSIIHEKQFVVFDRYRDSSRVSKNSRIDTLCQNFGLEGRRFRRGQPITDITAQNIDYPKVNERLARQKDITNRYLQEVFAEIRAREEQGCGKSGSGVRR